MCRLYGFSEALVTLKSVKIEKGQKNSQETLKLTIDS